MSTIPRRCPDPQVRQLEGVVITDAIVIVRREAIQQL
jgi:hypothetical protein